MPQSDHEAEIERILNLKSHALELSREANRLTDKLFESIPVSEKLLSILLRSNDTYERVNALTALWSTSLAARGLEPSTRICFDALKRHGLTKGGFTSEY